MGIFNCFGAEAYQGPESESDKPISKVSINRYVRRNNLHGYAVTILPGGPIEHGYSENLSGRVFLAITELGRRGSTRNLVLKLGGNFSKGELEVIQGAFRLYSLANKRPFKKEVNRTVKRAIESREEPKFFMM